MEKRIIRYYNVWFILVLRTYQDSAVFFILEENIKAGRVYQMQDILNWCRNHNIQWCSKFRYRKDFPILANMWNWYSYQKFRKESGINSRYI